MKDSQRKFSASNSEDESQDGKATHGMQQMRLQSEAETNAGLKGDYLNLFLLLGLYFLQGIPLGIVDAVPLILVNKGVTYENQALFSFVGWPFSLKLLWAPIVDSLYSSRFGRRKSWFVPVQYSLGLTMIAFSFAIDHILANAEKDTPISTSNVLLLTVAFFIIIFLTATQDIAVDGWALTMLSKRNVEYAPSCNSVGQMIGVLCGSTLFLALESSEFCNRWLRSTPHSTGIVSLGSYLLFWGIVFLVVTTFVMFFKKETSEHNHAVDPRIGIVATYKMLWKIINLRTVKKFAIVLLTVKIGVAAADAVTKLKLVEFGLKRENHGLLKLPLIPIQIIAPWIVTKFAIKKPMRLFYYSYPFRLLAAAVNCLLLWGTAMLIRDDKSFPGYYYGLAILVFAIEMIVSYFTGITLWSFMARVSDPEIGGTYMTLLTTVSNLGSMWTSTVAIYFVKYLTFQWCPEKSYFCSVSDHKFNVTTLNVTVADKITKYDNVTDVQSGPIVDGFYVETCICILIGIIWMCLIHKSLKWLESVPKSSWRCKK